MTNPPEPRNERITTPEQWLVEAGYSPEYRLAALAGGDINDTARLTTACGRQFCLKQNATAPEDFFAAEAAGLRAIAASETLPVPGVVCVAPTFILLEYITPGQKHSRYWSLLGEGLAQMHGQTGNRFGFEMDNYCGLTPQRNPWSADGHAFFREHRIGFQARLAYDRRLLQKQELKQIEGLAGRLEELIPAQPPALIHGDLWSGNIHSDAEGGPVLIDPAAYYGWPEAELAMTLLFGGFAQTFYDSYLAHHPLEPGWRERVPLYNLYHLLNHLNLFGGGYHSQVMATVRRFT